jgi:hypothetical protein
MTSSFTTELFFVYAERLYSKGGGRYSIPAGRQWLGGAEVFPPR